MGEIESLNDLNCHLYSMRQAAIYDIFAQICLHEHIKKIHKGDSTNYDLRQTLPEGEITFTDFLETLSKLGETAGVETKRNANRFLTRNHLKEVFRITQSYCSQTKQLELMEKESWYQFARIVTNSLSHNHKLEFNNTDKKFLPVSYGESKITLDMGGQCLQLSLEVLLKLCDEIINFAGNKIK